MKYLVFDCAAPFAGVGVYVDDCMDVVSFSSLRDQGAELVPRIQDLLLSKNLALNQMDAILTTRGPGSFTGIRVGLASAMGLHMATHIPIFGYTLFQIAAFWIYSQENAFPFNIAMKSAQEDFFQQEFHDFGHTTTPWQARVNHKNTYYIHDLPLTLMDIVRAHEQGPQLWAQEAQTHAGEPLYIRPPDTSCPKAPPSHT